VCFAIIALLTSVVLGVPLLLVASQETSFLTQSMTAELAACVPAWSMIAGAVGASWQRKLRFSAGLLGFVIAFDLVGYVTGWLALVDGATVVRSVWAALLILAHQVILVAMPVVTLVLFAGKRPSVFWEDAPPS
jgi:hypothetical protein